MLGRVLPEFVALSLRSLRPLQSYQRSIHHRERRPKILSKAILPPGLRPYPAYYAHMGGINRTGPAVLGHLPTVNALAPDDVAKRMGAGA
jgi:hypothetical protein